MTSAEHIRCPYCGGEVPIDTTICPGCQEDLSALIKLQYAHAIRYNEALALAREGRLEQAVARAELSLAAKSDFAPSLVLLAKLNARLGRWVAAQANIRRAAELAPEDARVKALAEEIETHAEAAEQAPLAEAQPAPEPEPEPRAAAVKQLGIYERDVKRAFGMGAAAMAALAVLWRLFFGRRND